MHPDEPCSLRWVRSLMLRLLRLACRTLTLAMAAGIGFFLAHIGYQAGEGIGLVVADPATLVTLGGCLSIIMHVLQTIQAHLLADRSSSLVCGGEAASPRMCQSHLVLSLP